MTRAASPLVASRVLALAWAEFLKIWASRIPLAFMLVVPVITYAFVLELYHVEQVGERLVLRNAIDAIPILYFATSKTLLFHAAVVAFAAFWATVDSQYGMIRVACAQPISRVDYLVAKWCGIGMHVALFTVVLVLSIIGWAAGYSGLRGVDAHAWAAVARFAAEVVLFVVALAGVAMATASFRRTVGAGLVTAFLVVVALALMTMVPFDLLSPRFVFMRYFFFPLGEFPDPRLAGGDSPFVRVHTVIDFCAVVAATPLIVAAPALIYFRRRDITE